MGYLAQEANKREVDAADLGVTPEHVARIVALVDEGTLSVALGRRVVDVIVESGGAAADVDAIVAERGLQLTSDTDALGTAADEAIAAQPDIAAKVRDGKVNAVGPLIGAVRRAVPTADAATVRTILLQKLGVEG
jgi:aspartyl-tRNA(Asn)/glutamyl-tRNA(Gln) amidotransferase subunit B